MLRVVNVILWVVSVAVSYYLYQEVFLGAPQEIDGFQLNILTSESAQFLVLYALMITGALSKTLFDISSKTVKFQSKYLWRALTSTAFVRSIIVSPIVFYSMYWALTTTPEFLVSAFISFQNGFFWQTVLNNEA